ncbi:XkdX family protein [Lacticaseibacillus kribbianus]|nr:XkdX family protein [Lacticaseibacillus kribbianus]
MTDFEQCEQFYTWGIDIAPYVGLMITAEEYEKITGSEVK